MYIFLSRAFFADNQYLKFLLQLIQYPRYLLRPKIKTKKEKKKKEKDSFKKFACNDIVPINPIEHNRTIFYCPLEDKQTLPAIGSPAWANYPSR